MAPPSLRALLDAAAPQLILTNRKLTAVPEEVRSQRALSHLGLQRNQLHELPAWLGELRTLRSLYLGQNPLEALPEGLGALPLLQRLLLSETPLTRLPDDLGESPVVFVHLDAMPMLDWAQALAVLARCPGLTSLSLCNNPRLAPHADGLGALRSLRQVYLAGCGLTEVPVALCELPALTEVSLVDNPLTRIPDALVLRPTLERLLLPKGKALAAERARVAALRPELR
jgi:Leucine-rich repeat (LRR) protein